MDEEWSARAPIFVGTGAVVALVGGLAVWGLSARLAGAVVSPGAVEVETNRQVVQHFEGGIVGEVRVRDGDAVAAGDAVLVLDDTLLRSELAAIEAQQIELAARRARLEAERDGLDEMSLPPRLDALRSAGDDRAAQIGGQVRLFSARRDALLKRRAQIAEQSAQLQNQIEGAQAQLAALGDMEALTGTELDDLQALLDRGLTQARQVTTVRREAARLQGEIGKITADIAGLRAEIARLSIETLALETERREAAISLLRDVQVRELELAEAARQVSARLARMEIRAPVSGIVHDTAIFVRDAVVRPGEALMYIVPQDQPLIVSARVETAHVDEVVVGQTAVLRFTAFDHQRTPEVDGQVISISPDVFTDEATGAAYYRVRIKPDAAGLDALDGGTLLPGMPVEAYLQTGDRSPVSYLMKPLSDYLSRAMRES